MPKAKPGQDQIRYEVITQETPEGDLLIPIPEPVLRKMGWKEGDEVEIAFDDKGQLYLKKN